ncbi:MAG: outer membrane beta-barrel protein [Rhodobacteraceae bacterium]|nr:outer membrane beta-barrel protein [Paracoccaceae bacterium]
MKLKLATTLLAVSIAGAASAQSSFLSYSFLSAAVSDSDGWGGFYTGSTSSNSSGDLTYYDGPDSYFSGPFDIDGPSIGAFAGYNIQGDTFTYGIEVAYMGSEVGIPPLYSQSFSDFTDIKFRAGFAGDRTMIYGVVGQTYATWHDGGALDTFTAKGMNYGVGIDFRIMGQIFVGAEYLVRDLTGYYGTDSPSNGWHIDFNEESLQLRVGINF